MACFELRREDSEGPRFYTNHDVGWADFIPSQSHVRRECGEVERGQRQQGSEGQSLEARCVQLSTSAFVSYDTFHCGDASGRDAHRLRSRLVVGLCVHERDVCGRPQPGGQCWHALLAWIVWDSQEQSGIDKMETSRCGGDVRSWLRQKRDQSALWNAKGDKGRQREAKGGKKPISDAGNRTPVSSVKATGASHYTTPDDSSRVTWALFHPMEFVDRAAPSFYIDTPQTYGKVRIGGAQLLPRATSIILGLEDSASITGKDRPY